MRLHVLTTDNIAYTMLYYLCPDLDFNPCSCSCFQNLCLLQMGFHKQIQSDTANVGGGGGGGGGGEVNDYYFEVTSINHLNAAGKDSANCCTQWRI